MVKTHTSNSHTDLSGIHIVVTGASSGIGLAMAEGLLRVGATVDKSEKQ